MTLHPSPITCEFLFSTALISPKMCLSHLENMPLSHSRTQGAQRSSWKLWLFCSIVMLLFLCSFSWLIFIFLQLETAKEPCMAKFGPLPSKWQMASSEPPCVNKVSDWKLEILQNGLYLIYGQVAPNANYNDVAPFEVRLYKNKDMIQTLTNKSKIQNVGGTYELHVGDTIDLIFNSEHQVLKNNTYWGIILLANPQFIS
ncbi:TNFSF18 isoform 1 [Pan troglodytes]|nr:tumor necrosis factor ligand superfamily member 18 [Pan troglodytes]XP_057158068.1 tumor necrosis factor ligand superfamily member 4 isoform X4 [Pan paniscus]KAI2520445.1 TNF superfamily member 18 [Homo sapiens]KAI4083967.1 TNF superfamily member 18 [Homo sapiens]PNI20262.1 TNFSF18 isoform 1 [Pan troglodytes]CTQ86083.1 TPA: tumor necrosis factor ligand 2A [Homo sapiens]CTQ86098.1 TPA: tumor necrosis factor ligand 2A [Pan troglodytes]|eukprot:NP_005083.2 tumor necrosis factor ligand superfamily member 18 [Homo sapiens]